MKRIAFLLCVLGGCWLSMVNHVQAQPFSENPEEFIIQFREKLSRFKTPYIVEFNKRLSAEWNNGSLTESMQRRAIMQVNALSAKGWSLAPGMTQYLGTLLTLRAPTTQITVRPEDFFAVTDSCLKYYNNEKTTQYFKWVEQFAPKGMVFETGVFKWRLGDRLPRFEFYNDTLRGQSFPALVYRRTNISFYTRGDSGQIKDVTGYLDLFDRKFHGERGRYDWSRAGLKPTEVYCEFERFKLDMTLISFRIDTVTFFYPSLLPQTLEGSLEEYLEYYNKPENMLYPYFKSYSGGMRITNFVPHVDYEGGFSMRGVTKIGSRTDDAPATLFVNKSTGEEALKIAGESVELNPIRMVMDDAAITLFLPNGDSLYHASMQLLYTVQTQDLMLTIDRKKLVSRQPIRNSYHKLEMYFDAIKWNPNQDTIGFTAIVDKEHKLFAVESYDYYSRQRINTFKGLLPFNPIELIFKYYVFTNYKPEPKEPIEEETQAKEDEVVWDDWGFEDSKFDKKKKEEEKEPEPAEEEKQPERILKKEFYVDEILKHYKLQRERKKFDLALLELEGSGFIYLQSGGKKLVVRERTINWGAAALGVKDYDVISIVNQREEGYNAQLDLKRNVLEVYGVENFMLSDSQFVLCVPEDQTIYAYQNRGLGFGGKVLAGKINLSAKGRDRFRFHYDDFKVVCDSLQDLTFSPERDPDPENDSEHAQRLAEGLKRLRLEGLSGTLYIDNPLRKNGLQSKPYYSAFDCHTPSFVYWDDPVIQKGVYNRENLYFQLDPFLIDSLSTFNMEALEFMGEMRCGPIMASFRDTLKPVSDNSYGISELMPEEGKDLYSGRGIFYNRLNMDGFGLHGNGGIAYRTSYAESDTFVFHFDSVMAITKSFVIEKSEFEGAFYPSIQVNKVRYKWYPQKDVLKLQTIDEPIVLYDGEVAFFGTLLLTPSGVMASGSMTVGQEQFVSDSIRIGHNELDMKTGSYLITEAEQASKVHMEGKNMTAKRNMKTGNTSFSSLNPTQSPVRFPLQKYSSTLSGGSWQSNNKTIQLEAAPNDSIKRFAATDSSMHGLQFNASKASYALDEEILKVEGVDSFFVADAILYPNGKKMQIDNSGFISRLENCRITANQENRLHAFTEANAQIVSGIEYLADGRYSYIPINDVPQDIYFEDIYVRKDTVTVARTVIPEEKEFFITERFYFKDTVILKANEKFMSFAGQVKIQTNNPALSESWIPVNIPNANPDSIVVTISQEQIGEKAIGVMVRSDRHAYYSLFLNNKINRRDESIFSAEGVITFDRKSKEFRIGPLAKLKGQKYRGNAVSYLELNDSNEVITSRGHFDFPVHFSSESRSDQSYSLDIAGEWRQDETKNEITTDWVMAVDFHPAMKPVMEYLAKLMMGWPSSEGEADVSDPELLAAAAELTDKETPDEKNIRAIAKMANSENTPAAVAINFAQHVPVSLLLGNVRMRYCEQGIAGASGYFFCDQPIALMGVAGQSQNKKVRCKILYTVGSKRGGRSYRPDKFQIFLEIADEQYLYFELEDNKMKAYGTNPAFMGKLLPISTKLNKKSKGGSFNLQPANEIDIENFRRQFGRIQTSGCSLE